jgi:alkylhydroperoxidase/carboxymuconolactone decarboxylase family protein YurZ
MLDESNDTPVLDTIAVMTAASIERSNLNANEFILVRLAALAAVDARPLSYLAHVAPSVEADVTLEQVQDVLVAIAPIVGTARVVSAALNIAEALGVAVAVAEEELEEELEALAEADGDGDDE